MTARYGEKFRPFLEAMGALYAPEDIASALIETEESYNGDVEPFLNTFVLKMMGYAPVGLHRKAIEDTLKALKVSIEPGKKASRARPK